MCDHDHESSSSDSIAQAVLRQVSREEIFRAISLHETLPGQKIQSPYEVLSSLKKRARCHDADDEPTQKKQKAVRLFGAEISSASNPNPIVRNHELLQEIEQQGGSKPVFLFQKRVWLPLFEKLVGVRVKIGEIKRKTRSNTNSCDQCRAGAFAIDPWLHCMGVLICDGEWIERIKEKSLKRGDSLLQVWGYVDMPKYIPFGYPCILKVQIRQF